MITITVLKNPFNHNGKEIHTSEHVPGKTAYEYIQPYIMGLDDYVVSVSGNIAADVKERIVANGDWIAVCPVVGNSKWGKIFATLLIGGLTGGLFGGGSLFDAAFGKGVFTTAAGLIGGALINHWFPQPKPDIPDIDPSYSWNNTQALTGQGNALTVTYGTMRTAGQILAQHVSSKDEDQYLNILLCGGEGPIDSISDIRINNNPVDYYKDVPVEIRLGDNDQPVITNFKDTYVDQALAYELDTGVDWIIHQTEGTAVQGLEITLQFPYGLYYSNNDGGLSHTSVTVQAQYRRVGAAEWTNLTNGAVTITKATNTAFQVTYQVGHLPAAQYEVRARCVSKSGTTVRYGNRVFWTQLSSIMYDDFVRPGKVLVGVKALATNQLSGGMPNITWIQTRQNVWVWNPQTGQYQQKPATNPAWAVYDILHRCRRIMNVHTGSYEFVVQGAPVTRLVYQDFANWAAFCDDRSLTFNYIFTTASDLWTALQKPESVGRGKVILRGTKYGCVCDAPGTPVQMFTVGNILTDKFQEAFSGLKDRANAIEITFANKDKGYDKDVITAYADDYDASTEPNITQITLDGITTMAQAYREGKYRLRLNRYLTRTVEHSADIDAIACQINDVVLLAHDVPQWGVSGRLLAATATTLQLDREVTLEPGKSYAVAIQITNPTAATADAVQNIVTVNVQGGAEEVTTDTVTLTQTLTTVPQQWDLYSFGETNKVVKPFRVLSISRDQDLRRKITCLEYVEAVYNEATDVPEISYSQLETTSEISRLSVAEESYLQKDGTVMTMLHAGWTLSRNARVRSFNVYISEDDGQTWRLWGNTTDRKITVTGVKTGEVYRIKICTVNYFGIASLGVISAGIYITGKDEPPSNIPNIYAAIDASDRTKATITWDAVADVDLRGYQLYERDALLTPTPISDTRYVYTAAASREHTFAVYAVDNSGHLSKIPAMTTIMITVNPATVAGFHCVIQDTDRSRLNLSWSANAETDIAHYEIRTGNDGWDSATIIATQLKATSFSYQLSSEGYQTFMIKAVSTAGYASIEPSAQTLQILLRPDAPNGLSAVQEPNNRAMLAISWLPSSGKDMAEYQLKYGSNWETGTPVGATRETSYRWTLPASGTYTLMVRAKTVAGYLSNVTNHTVSPMIEPYDVTGFVATQSIADRTKVTLLWNNPISQDVAYHVIKKGVSWDDGVIVASRATGTVYDAVVTEETEQTFWIKAVSMAGYESQNPVSCSGIFSLRPSPVSTIQMKQQLNDKSVVEISWEAVSESDLAGYQVKIGYVWETAQALPLTKELSILYHPPATDTYKVMVKAVTAAGYFSEERSLVQHVTLEPLPVAGFQALQNGEFVQFYWDKHPENDVVAYEIREGASFHSGSLVDTGITTNSYSVKVDVERNYQYHIKAINRSNRYSTASVSRTVYVSNLPPKNVIVEYDEIVNQNGIHDHTEFGLSYFNWQTIGGSWSDYPTTKFSEIGGQQVLKLAKLPDDTYPAQGVYVCEPIDLGQVITCNIGHLFTSSVNLSKTGSAKLQIRISQDGITWTAWADFKPAEYTFRYLERRVLLATDDSAKTPEVGQFATRIDVPDTVQSGTVIVPVGGIEVLYPKTFYTVPVITGMAIGSNRFPEIVEGTETPRGHIVKIVDRTGADVGGKYNYSAKGY